jgi:2,3-diketo-5-methylthio-1-phosphopentane phosphatase/HAD superfamily hydrolase (TIGR01509 family)
MLKQILTRAKNPIVLSDFDGTISTRDISYEILKKFSDGTWQDIDAAYIRGDIGSKEAFSQIIDMIRASKEDLVRFIADIAPIDPSFAPFYRSLADIGVDFAVVSDGFSFYINPLLEREGLSDVTVYANDIIEDNRGKLVPVFPHHNDECNSCGNCKRSIIEELKKEYDHIVFIGDGYSDRCASELADTLFAKQFLYAHAVKNRRVCIHFDTFDDIIREFDKDIRGVIFDLDETLVESLDAIRTSFVHTVETLDLDIDIDDAFKRMMHWPLADSMERIFSGADLKELVRVFREKYYAIYKEMTPLRNGMENMLHALSEGGVKLSVATNKHGRYARELLDHLAISDLFVSVIGAGDVENPKPSPDMIDAALKQMGTKKDDTVFVGDSIVDSETAKNTGIDFYCLAMSIDPPEKLSQREPKKIFFDIEQLSRELISNEKY